MALTHRAVADASPSISTTESVRHVSGNGTSRCRTLDTEAAIVIVFPEGEIDSVPSLLAAIHEFSRLGYHVHVFAREREGYLRPPSAGRVRYCWHRSLKRGAHWVDIIARGLYWLVASVRIRCRTRVACVIGVDQSGLIWARWLDVVLGAPLVYWSLEIQPREELSTAREHRMKTLEQHAARDVSALIVQDQEREQLLRDCSLVLTGVPTVLVPNSPEGRAAKRRSRYLRDFFGIADNARIILHSGSLAEWACALELAESTQAWPEDWVLVFHSCRSMGSDQYTALVRKATRPGRIYLSEEPLSSDRYPELVRSAHIGVAFYREIPGCPTSQRNARHIGWSSGKAASYLFEGVPIIYTGGGLFDATWQEYGCGEKVHDPRHTVDAISTLFENYEARCTEAVRCFNERLRVDGRFSRLLHVLNGP